MSLLWKITLVAALLLTSVTPTFARELTGEGGKKPFGPGANVVGAVIEFSDGSVVYGCHIYNSQFGGIVTSGVIDPWPGEMTKFPPCFGQEGAQTTPPPSNQLGVDGKARVLTSGAPGDKLPFAAGDAVVGGWIEMNGKGQGPCYLSSAPTNGIVSGGVIHYWEGEEARFPACTN